MSSRNWRTHPRSNFETVIIGAGPAGLTAAYLLSAKHHRSVLVLERDPEYVGGISRTVQHNGFHFDIGGHRFFSKSQAIVDLWNEILPNDFLERPRLSRIYYNGKFYNYPLKATEALRNLGPIESALCMASFGYAKLAPVKDPRTFHGWVRNQFGERLFSIFFKTYTEKVWGMSCDEISADWAAQRIKGLSLGTAVTNSVRRSLGLRGTAKGTAVKTLIESFQYPRKGPGMMWDAAARRVTESGGQIELGQSVTRLDLDSDRGLWTVHARRQDGTEHCYEAEHVLSSAPLRDLMDMMNPQPASRIETGRLRYRDFLTVVLMSRSSQEFPDNWVYIHDPAVRVGRVQNFKSWSPEMVPNPSWVCLGLEYFCTEGDDLWTFADDSLIALAKSEIGKIGLMDPAHVEDACVVRQPKAYPVYDGTYAIHVKAARDEIARRYPNLHLIGRNGMHKYNNQDHAMMTGMLTALNIVAGKTLYDVWRVNEDAEYAEEGVSGADRALASERLVPKSLGQA